MSLYASLQGLCGLSNREAAEFFNVSLSSIDKWRKSDRNPPPRGALDDLAALHARQRKAAQALLEIAKEQINAHGPNGAVPLGFSSDDAEAQSLGWPCASAHKTALAMVAAAVIPLGVEVIFVPRGSTPATAAAADAHRK